MPGLSGRRFSELNQVRVGMVTLASLAVLLAFALNIGAISRLFTGETYVAHFTNGGGIRSGDDVRVSGLDVGRVTGVSIDGPTAKVEFEVDTLDLGDRTTLEIRSANALGRRYLAVTPAGVGRRTDIPVSDTSPGYGVTQAVGDLTRTTTDVDVDQLAESFDELASTFADTPDEVAASLDGLSRLSKAVSSRDEALTTLFDSSERVAGVLANRRTEIERLMTDGSALFAEIQSRRDDLAGLMVHTQAVTRELSGLVDDNEEQIGPTLRALHDASALLRKNEDNIAYVLRNASGFARALGETVGGGPFFYSYLQNLVPTNLAPLLPTLFPGAAR